MGSKFPQAGDEKSSNECRLRLSNLHLFSYEIGGWESNCFARNLTINNCFVKSFCRQDTLRKVGIWICKLKENRFLHENVIQSSFVHIFYEGRSKCRNTAIIVQGWNKMFILFVIKYHHQYGRIRLESCQSRTICEPK